MVVALNSVNANAVKNASAKQERTNIFLRLNRRLLFKPDEKVPKIWNNFEGLETI